MRMPCWMSQLCIGLVKQVGKLSSPEIQIMQNPKDWAIHVFVKKSDDEGLDFYYLGEVQPKSRHHSST